MRVLSIIVTLGVMLVALPAHAQGRAAGVTTDLVTTQSTSETVTVFGQIVASRSSDVAARVGGVAANVPIDVGQQVIAGDVLAEIDREQLRILLASAQAQVSLAEAGIVVAEARLDRAQKAFERAQRLLENSAIPEATLDDRSADFAEASGALREAQARWQAADAALSNARYDYDNAVVIAPFDAIVLDVFAEVGQFVASGSRVATLLDTGALEVEANVPSRIVGALQPDQDVVARTDSGETLTLTLRAVLPTEFSSTRTRPVRFVIANEALAVAVGQSLTLDVPVSAPRSVVVVPKDALVQARGGWSVFVHVEGKAQPRQVSVGAAIGNFFEVTSGLAPGDEVVVRGNERLRPGQDIAPTRIERETPADSSERGSTPTGDAPSEQRRG